MNCEVCGAEFETRRGLSSHARSHLRQFGISFSESSRTPADLLYQIAKERGVDCQESSPFQEPSAAKNSSSSVPQKDEDLEDMDLDEKPIPPSLLAKAAKALPPSSFSTPSSSPSASPVTPHSGSPSSVVRKAPISSLLPVSSPLRSQEHKAGGMKSLTSNPSAPGPITSTKPLWAPQENDAPLNLSKSHHFFMKENVLFIVFRRFPIRVQHWRWTPTRTSFVSCAVLGLRLGRVSLVMLELTCDTLGWSIRNPRALPSTS